MRLLPLDEFELEDAKQRALPTRIEKWLHDLKSNKKDSISCVFREIKETVADNIVVDLSVYRVNLLKSIANKDTANLQDIISKIRDSIKRRPCEEG